MYEAYCPLFVGLEGARLCLSKFVVFISFAEAMNEWWLRGSNSCFRICNLFVLVLILHLNLLDFVNLDLWVKISVFHFYSDCLIVFPAAADTTTCWRTEQLSLLAISLASKDYNTFVLSKYHCCNLLVSVSFLWLLFYTKLRARRHS